MKPQTTVRQEFHMATTYTKMKTQLLVTNNFNLYLIQQNNAGRLLFCSSEQPPQSGFCLAQELAVYLCTSNSHNSYFTFCSHSLSQHCLSSSWNSIQQDASNYRQTCQINVLCYTSFQENLEQEGEKEDDGTHTHTYSVYLLLPICPNVTYELQFKNQQINFIQTM